VAPALSADEVSAWVNDACEAAQVARVSGHAEDLAGSLFELLERVDRPADRVLIMSTQIGVLMDQCDHHRAAELAAEMVTLLEAANADPVRRARAASTVGWLANERGDVGEAARWLGEALWLLELSNGVDLEATASITNTAGLIFRGLNAPELAVVHLERSVHAHETLGPSVRSDFTKLNLCDALIDGANNAELLGETATARSLRERAIGVAEGLADETAQRHVRLVLVPLVVGACRCAMGDRDAASSIVDQLTPLAAELDAPATLLRWHHLRARVARAAGDSAGALAALTDAAPAIERDNQLEGLDALHLKASLEAESGDLSGALQTLRDADQRARRWSTRRLASLASVVLDRADLETSNRRLERIAGDDPLTGLLNRRGLDLALSVLTDHRGIAVLAVDLDHFKDVNDRFGHGIGDDVLRSTGQLLLSAVRTSDLVARVGGEEFLIVLTDPQSIDVSALAERVRLAFVSERWGSIAAGLGVTTSIGVATGLRRQFEAVLFAADNSLYEAKRAGRNRVAIAA
jgi:diguanylate cyclase (GGDEF)-like protein